MAEDDCVLLAADGQLDEVGQYTDCDNASRRWLYRLKPLSRVSDRSLPGTTWCQPQSVQRGGTETAEPAAK